jgi:hypothetical protein
MQKKVLPQFGEAVSRLLADRGLSDRQGQYKTGIDRITIADMRNGYVPRLEQVERFAAGFGLDINEWRALAGYEDIRSGSDLLLAAVQQMREENPGLDVFGLLNFADGKRTFTVAEAEEMIEHLRADVEAVLREREGG